MAYKWAFKGSFFSGERRLDLPFTFQKELIQFDIFVQL